MNFDEAFEILIGHEGKYTNNRKDRGNWTSGKIGIGKLKGTKFGISAMAYPHLDIVNLTLAEAKEIYKKDYWDKVRCEEIPEVVMFDVFDTAVNSGVFTAIKILQKAAKTNPDGIFGEITMSQINKFNEQILDKRFNGYRLYYIADIETFPTFGKGWIRRVAHNLVED